jgi:hypothetical protein
MSFNWKRPMTLEPEVGIFVNEITHEKVELPLVNRKERFAEKVCAFLERRDDPCRDAFDLYFYFTSILHHIGSYDYPALIQQVAVFSDLPDGTDLPELANQQMAKAQADWPGKTIFQGRPPDWGTVEPVLQGLLPMLPPTLNRTCPGKHL